MMVELLSLLSKFRVLNDRESEAAYFRTNIPWVGSQAYLNIVFKPAPPEVLVDTAGRLGMPGSLVEFLQIQNGAILFSGALSVCGVHRPGQLLNREQPFSQLPFNIEDENDDWPPNDPERFLSLGGYSFDGSEVCIDRGDSRIYLFQRDEEALASSPSASWRSLEEWITSEISRLSFLFSHDGHRLAAESQTLPVRGLPC